jgi:hypothetical protein
MIKFSYSTSNEVSANLSEIEKLLLVTGESKSGFQKHTFILPSIKTVRNVLSE